MVFISSAFSDPIDLKWGVPQGSVAWPFTFFLFSAPMQTTVAAHGLQCTVYAEDTQLFITFPSKDRESTVRKMESCTADIRSWTCYSFKRQQNWTLPQGTANLRVLRNSGSATQFIPPVTNVQNLGAVSQHVNSVSWVAFAGIHKILHLRYYL